MKRMSIFLTVTLALVLACALTARGGEVSAARKLYKQYLGIPEDNPRDRAAALENIREYCLRAAPLVDEDDFRMDRIFAEAISALRSVRTQINWKEGESAAREYFSALRSYPRPYPAADYYLTGGGRYGAAEGLDGASLKERFAGRWPAVAEAMIEEQEQLSRKLWDVRTPQEAMELRSLCRDFESRRSALKGIDAAFRDNLDGPAGILETLDGTSIELSVEDDLLRIFTRNVKSPRIKVSCKDPSYQLRRTLANASPKYYIKDTLALPLEGLKDGDYKIEAKSGKVRSSLDYQRTSISVAGRWRNGRYEIYAADMATGEPVREAVATCRKWGGSDDGQAHSFPPITLKLDGFTAIPAAWADAVTDTSYIDLRLQGVNAGSERVLSERISIHRGYTQEPRPFHDDWRAVLFTDCAAFHPGDSIRFKGIIYTSLEDKSLRLRGEGVPVRVELVNPKGEMIETLDLITGELSSVNGGFRLPSGELVTGRWYVRLVMDGRCLASRPVVVDEYVTPSYELTFSNDKEKYYRGDTVVINGLLKSYSGNAVAAALIRYSIWTDKEQTGTVHPSEDGHFSITVTPGPEVGFLHLNVDVTDARGESLAFSHAVSLVDPEAEKKAQANPRLVATGRDGVSARVESIPAGLWGVVEVWGPSQTLLSGSLLRLDQDIDIQYKAVWPEEVKLCVLWFWDGRRFTYELGFSRPRPSLVLPLQWERTAEEMAPGEKSLWSVSTVAGAEVAVAVFDKSTLTLSDNVWPRLVPVSYGPSRIYPDIWCGSHSSYSHRPIKIRGAARAKAAGMVLMSATADNAMFDSAPMAVAEAVEEDAVLSGDGGLVSAPVRSQMAEVLAFWPALRSGADGRVSFEIPSSDKLTTYIVRVYAHDGAGRCVVDQRELTVRLDTEVSVLQPRFLYDGDSYVMHYTVTSRSGAESFTKDFGTVRRASSGPVLEYVLRGVSPDGGSADALKVNIPVKERTVTVTEAHSAIFGVRTPVSRLRDSLASSFANKVSVSDIEFVEESLLEGVHEYLDRHLESGVADDAVALSGALFYKDAPTEELLGRLNALRSAEGGYSWMAGMKPSAGITALVIERLHLLGLDREVSAQSVQWLDATMSDDKRSWYSGLSDEQYFYVRSMFPQIEYKQKRQHRGLLSDEGGIVFKARRVLTLRNLSASDEGKALARKWGAGVFFTGNKLQKQTESDVYALRQYAVAHPSGGMYFPNAVMPWRGLQENEIYAHTLLCRVFREDSIGDGLRLWMMVQKQTQAWRSSPNMIEACKAVLEGSAEVLSTRLITASALVSTPIPELKASSNEMSVARSWQLRGADGKWRDLVEGETLRIGQEIRAVYRLWSQENRSFVRLYAPVPACLAPVDQLSGYRWWGCYRQVRPDAMEYYWDSYPEEKIEVSEMYRVTQEGRFIIPEASVECLYAPAWRGNDGFEGYFVCR